MARAYTYILLCADKSYYIGSTRSLLKRFKEHQMGEGAKHTSKHLPVALVYFEEYNSKDSAYLREIQLKGWTRKKKQALMMNRKTELKKLTICKNQTHHSNKNKRTLINPTLK